MSVEPRICNNRKGINTVGRISPKEETLREKERSGSYPSEDDR